MPQKNDYERVGSINKKKTYFLIISSVITLLLTLNEKYKLTHLYPELNDYLVVVIGLNSMLIVSYVSFEMRANYIFTKAEKLRRLQYLDNSFNTNFAGRRVENYFTQDQIEPGFYKLCVNCFENNFHTYNVVRSMQSKIFGKAVIVLMIFIFSASVGDKSTIRTLIESILPLALVQDAIKTSIIITRLEGILDSFKSFFTALKTSTFTNKEPEAMKLVIDYETTLAWASMPTDSAIFLAMRTELALEWEDLKREYQLKYTT